MHHSVPFGIKLGLGFNGRIRFQSEGLGSFHSTSCSTRPRQPSSGYGSPAFSPTFRHSTLPAPGYLSAALRPWPFLFAFVAAISVFDSLPFVSPLTDSHLFRHPICWLALCHLAHPTSDKVLDIDKHIDENYINKDSASLFLRSLSVGYRSCASAGDVIRFPFQITQ